MPQSLYMYSYRALLWNSQLCSSCYLVRDFWLSSTLDSLAADSAHTPMSSSIFLFSCKIVSRAIWTLFFNIIRSVLKCVIFPWKIFSSDYGALLNVSVSICTGCPTTTTSTWAFAQLWEWFILHIMSFMLLPMIMLIMSVHHYGFSPNFSWPPTFVKTICCSSFLIVKHRYTGGFLSILDFSYSLWTSPWGPMDLIV